MGNFCSLGQEKKRKVKRSPYQKSSFTKVLSLSQLERGVTVVVVILQCQVFNKNLGSWSRQQIFQLANSCIGMATIQKCENPPEPSFLWDSSVAMEYRYHIIDYYNTCCIQSLGMLYWESRELERGDKGANKRIFMPIQYIVLRVITLPVDVCDPVLLCHFDIKVHLIGESSSLCRHAESSHHHLACLPSISITTKRNLSSHSWFPFIV